MAEFFKANGCPFPIANGTFDEAPSPVGVDDVMHSGTSRRTRRTKRRRVFRGSGIEMSPGRANDLESMIEGDGEVWALDHATKEERGSKGHGVRVGSTWSRVTSSPSPVYGDACILVSSGDVFILDVALVAPWTAFFWKFDVELGAWASFSVKSTGAYSQDGVSPGIYDPADFTDVATGYLILQGNDVTGSSSNSNYDHIAIVPWLVDEETELAYTGQSTTPWSAPRLTLEGACIVDDGGVDVFGDVTVVKSVQGNIGEGAGFENNLRKVSFSLSEVL